MLTLGKREVQFLISTRETQHARRFLEKNLLRVFSLCEPRNSADEDKLKGA